MPAVRERPSGRSVVVRREEVLRQELAVRWSVAHTMLSHAIGHRVTLEELGLLMAKAARRKEPWAAPTVHRIASGQAEPDAEQVLAFCAVCADAGLAIDPGWLHYGQSSQAPAPDTR